jgi:hypothetical protein
MSFLNGMTLPAALIISSLIIGYALLENGRSNRFKLTATVAGLAIKLDSHTGKVQLCKTTFTSMKINESYEKIGSVTCGENIDMKNISF